jgi:hypothetical protein
VKERGQMNGITEKGEKRENSGGRREKEKSARIYLILKKIF